LNTSFGIIKILSISSASQNQTPELSNGQSGISTQPLNENASTPSNQPMNENASATNPSTQSLAQSPEPTAAGLIDESRTQQVLSSGIESKAETSQQPIGNSISIPPTTEQSPGELAMQTRSQIPGLTPAAPVAAASAGTSELQSKCMSASEICADAAIHPLKYTYFSLS